MTKKIMVAMFIIFIWTLTVINLADAASVTLAWDPVDPVPTGYAVFQREAGEDYDYLQSAWEGTETTCIIGGLEAGKTYHFVVRAFVIKDGLRGESLDSNEVEFISKEEIIIQVPGNMVIKSSTNNSGVTIIIITPQGEGAINE